jgi:hypothetical protein
MDDEFGQMLWETIDYPGIDLEALVTQTLSAYPWGAFNGRERRQILCQRLRQAIDYEKRKQEAAPVTEYIISILDQEALLADVARVAGITLRKWEPMRQAYWLGTSRSDYWNPLIWTDQAMELAARFPDMDLNTMIRHAHEQHQDAAAIVGAVRAAIVLDVAERGKRFD